MAPYKTCSKCGAALDPGEICDCGRMERTDAAYWAKQAAIREAVEAEVTITLEKKKGSETFRRKIKASSAAAALNGLAVLLREYAKLVGVNEIEVLALLATVLTVPAMGNGEESDGHE